ncbi:MAG TPA: rRNA maturation RNase YbeY [Bacteroidales bacterium]|nr:rRNA maturation RNase YbeY [Bacteroidales bacterium]
MSVSYQNLQVSFKFKGKRNISDWIKSVANEEGFAVGNINIVFTTDEKLLEVNKEFLKHDFYTDIITFDYSENKVLSGDLMISIERVKENAIYLNVVFLSELHRVIIHGVLHLCGYKDKMKKDKTLMRAMENKYLAKLESDAKV